MNALGDRRELKTMVVIDVKKVKFDVENFLI